MAGMEKGYDPPHQDCCRCPKPIYPTQQKFAPYCSVNCREEYFVSIGAGDFRSTMINYTLVSKEPSWWDQGKAHP